VEEAEWAAVTPYIDEVKYKPATQKFKVTFLPSGKTIEVDPAKIPYGHNGLPGSILDFSEASRRGSTTLAAASAPARPAM
jgi:hypothetical protein